MQPNHQGSFNLPRDPSGSYSIFDQAPRHPIKGLAQIDTDVDSSLQGCCARGVAGMSVAEEVLRMTAVHPQNAVFSRPIEHAQRPLHPAPCILDVGSQSGHVAVCRSRSVALAAPVMVQLGLLQRQAADGVFKLCTCTAQVPRLLAGGFSNLAWGIYGGCAYTADCSLIRMQSCALSRN